MSPCLKVGIRPTSISKLLRHRNASGKNMSLTRFFSLLCRPSASGSTQTIAASKQADFSVNPLGHVLAYRLPHLRRKQRVKWKSAAAEPKMAPNLGTSHAHELNALVTLLVEMSSKRNLRMALLMKLRAKGGPAPRTHSLKESLSQQPSCLPNLSSS